MYASAFIDFILCCMIKDGLKEFLEKNKIYGDCLSLIESDSELKEWGIEIWRHRKLLFKNIKELTQQKKNENYNNDNNYNMRNNDEIIAQENVNQSWQTNEGYPYLN